MLRDVLQCAALRSLVAKPDQGGILEKENLDYVSWEIDTLLGPVMPVGSRQLDKSDRVGLDVHS